MSQKVVNLTFHGIGMPPREVEQGDLEFWVSPDFFLWVLDLAKERDDIRITFDDGNLSDFEIGFPALLDRGLKADFFICAGRIDQPGFLSASQIREMKSSGMRFGSHGYHHRSWCGLANGDLDEEIRGAKETLEAVVQAPILTASCPVGAYNAKVLYQLKQAGFKHVFTSDRGKTWSDEWLQSRNTVRRSYSSGDLEKLMSSPSPLYSEMKRRAKMFLKRWR